MTDDKLPRQNTDEILSRAIKTLEFEAATRGNVILATIELEEIIDHIIANYFCDNDKQADFRSTFLTDCGLTSKIDILKDILKINYPEIYTKIISYFEGKAPKILGIAKLRNQLAHSRVSYTEGYAVDEKMEEAIILQARSKKGLPVPYKLTKTEAKQKLKEIDAVCGTLINVLILVRRKQGRF